MGMLKRHPLGALLYVWGLDLIALAMLVPALGSVPHATVEQWGHFLLWVSVMCVAHLGGVVHFAGLRVFSGWQMAVDFTAAMVLPFPLFCLALLIRFFLQVADRYRRKHPEPWLGPDFNQANLILNAWAAQMASFWLTTWLGESNLSRAVTLMLTGLVFVTVQVLLTSTILSLDQRKPWTKVGSLDRAALLSNGMMMTAGALSP
jgi:hypothetical protein